MVKINNFVLHSDFPSPANDAQQDIEITIPNGWVVNNGHNYLTKDYTIGQKDASIRALMSVDGTNYYVGTSISWQQNVNYTGFGADVATMSATIRRINSTTLRLEVVGFSNSGQYTVTGARTIKAKVGTFISPYS